MDIEKETNDHRLGTDKSNTFSGSYGSDYLWLAIAAVFWYFISYISHPGMPGNSETFLVGWFGWHDQGKYLESARALSRFTLTPETYVYPLGYPALGAFFVRFLPRHPFLIPNLLSALFIVLTFYAACRTILTKKESFLLCVVLIFASGFASNKIIHGGLFWEASLIAPWNNIPVFLAYFVCIYLIIFRKADLKNLAFCSILIGYALFTRPPDAIGLLIIYLAGLLDLRALKERVSAIAIFGVSCALFLGITVLAKLYTFGTYLSAYDKIQMGVGFDYGNLAYKVYLILFDGMPIHQYSDFMLIPKMPWFLLVIPGIMVVSKVTSGKIYFLAGSMLISFLFYIGFNGMAPTLFYDYHCYRYFAWTYPWMGLFAYITLTRASKTLGWKNVALGTVPVFLLVAFLGWKEAPLAAFWTDRVAKQEAELKVTSQYNESMRNFTVLVDVPERKAVAGIRLFLDKNPSYHLSVAAQWRKLQVEADGRLLSLYKHYNLYQVGNAVTIAARNPIGQAGLVKNLRITFTETVEPHLYQVTLLQTRFQPFSLVKRLLLKLNLSPIAWRVSDDNKYEFGEKISFGGDGRSTLYKISGWGVVEKEHTWSEGNAAVLGFLVPSARKPVYLKMNLMGLTRPPDLPFQPVAVFANDKLVAEWKVSGKEEYQAVIPPSVIKKDGVLILELKTPRATSPARLGINSDKRILGVGCYTMELSLGPPQEVAAPYK